MAFTIIDQFGKTIDLPDGWWYATGEENSKLNHSCDADQEGDGQDILLPEKAEKAISIVTLSRTSIFTETVTPIRRYAFCRVNRAYFSQWPFTLQKKYWIMEMGTGREDGRTSITALQIINGALAPE